MKNMILLTLSAILLASCTNGGSSNNSPATIRPQFQGDLIEKAQSVYGSSNEAYFYSCDAMWKDKILEMTSAIEANKALITKLNNDQVSHGGAATVVKINGFDFIELVQKDHPDVWEQVRYSWKDTYQSYLQVKNNLSDPAWIQINSDARSLILDDQYRIHFSAHPGIRLKDKAIILQTFAIVEACNRNVSCTTLNLTTAQAAWLGEGNYHSYVLAQLNSSESYTSAREHIEWLYQDLKQGAGRFGFHINNDILVGNSVITVPMDFSVFAGDQNILIQRLQKLWSVYGITVQIVDSKTSFVVKVDSTPGERAFVSPTKKIMQLFTPTKFLTIEHEFGHVLGLEDTYFTSFDQVSCEYVEDFNRGDIMSAHGQVLPVHIDQIKKAYGMQ